MILQDVHSGHKWRNIIEVLHESLADKPRPIFIDDQEDFEEVRYKLIIDPTEDDSSRRLMMMFEILKPQQTTTVIGSDFSDDGYLQNVSSLILRVIYLLSYCLPIVDRRCLKDHKCSQ